MIAMLRFLISLLDDIRGATAIEYGVIGILIVTIVIVSLTRLGISLDSVVSAANNGLIVGQ
jgi:Flp pilus assembly pilin Flp